MKIDFSSTAVERWKVKIAYLRSCFGKGAKIGFRQNYYMLRVAPLPHGSASTFLAISNPRMPMPVQRYDKAIMWMLVEKYKTIFRKNICDSNQQMKQHVV